MKALAPFLGSGAFSTSGLNFYNPSLLEGEMSLLSEIQDECTATESSVSRILRLCLKLAARLKHAPLKDWVLRELNGYPDTADLPDYRIYQTRSLGHFADRMIGQATLGIPIGVLPEQIREKFSKARLAQPISQYEELLSGDSKSSFQLPWPPDLALEYGSKVSPMQCISAWQELPRAAVAGLVDNVKTRVLSMVLDIEAESPESGEIKGVGSPISEARVNQIFNTNIYGGQVQNLATGSHGVVQLAVSQVTCGDIESLVNFLKASGVQESDTIELTAALSEDKANGDAGIGRRVAEWLSHLAKKTGHLGGDIGKQTVIGLATQAVLAYLGIGS